MSLEGKNYDTFNEKLKEAPYWRYRHIWVEHTPCPQLSGQRTTKAEDEEQKNQLKLYMRDFLAGDFSVKPETEGQVARFSIPQTQTQLIRDAFRMYDFREESMVARGYWG